MRLGNLRSACLGGFLYGAIAHGAVLSLVHVLYNELGSTRDALVTLAWFVLLYGGWAAVFFGVAWVLKRGVKALTPRPPLPPPHAPSPGEGETLFPGLLLFNLVFWEIFWLYGRTYEEVPFGSSGLSGMVTFIAVAGLVIALAVTLGSWLLARFFRGVGRKTVLAAALLALVVHALAPLYAGRPEPVKTAAAPPRIQVQATGLKVVLVGLDGADWRVLRPLMEKGRLPTFTAMTRRGASGSLASLPDANSAVIWASMYTGATPDRHGVHDFYRVELPGLASAGLFPVHRTYFKELADLAGKVGLARQTMVSRFSLHTLPVWEIVDHAGLSLGLVDGYLFSVPAMKPSDPRGFFLSYGLDGFAQMPGGKSLKDAEVFAQPPQLFRQVRPLLGRDDFYWQSAVLFEMLRARSQPRFLNLYTHQPDVWQHWYWKWLEPRYFPGGSEEDQARYGGKIPRLHRDFDAFLGRLLAAVGPETVVIVASDHGHAPTILHGRFHSQHRHGPPGILLMQGGPVKPGHVLEGAGVYDLHPTLLYLLGLPVPEDAAGKVLLDALDPEFVRRHPVRTVPSYEPLGPARGLPGGGAAGGDAMNRQEIEKLKSLGYL